MKWNVYWTHDTTAFLKIISQKAFQITIFSLRDFKNISLIWRTLFMVHSTYFQ